MQVYLRVDDNSILRIAVFFHDNCSILTVWILCSQESILQGKLSKISKFCDNLSYHGLDFVTRLYCTEDRSIFPFKYRQTNSRSPLIYEMVRIIFFNILQYSFAFVVGCRVVVEKPVKVLAFIRARDLWPPGLGLSFLKLKRYKCNLDFWKIRPWTNRSALMQPMYHQLSK